MKLCLFRGERLLCPTAGGETLGYKGVLKWEDADTWREGSGVEMSGKWNHLSWKAQLSKINLNLSKLGKEEGKREKRDHYLLFLFIDKWS